MCLKSDPLRSFFLAVNGFVVYFAFAFNYPSLKEEIDSKGISQSWTGFILGVYSVPSFFFWLFFDKMVHRFGRKCMLLSGLYSFLLSLFLFGLIEFSVTPFSFVLTGLVTRFLLGICSYQHKAVLYSVGAKKYPQSVDKVFAYISMGINLGIGIGGFMGSFTYESFNGNLFYINALFSSLLLVLSAPMTHYLMTEKKSTPVSTQSKPAISRVDTGAVEKTISLKFLVCSCKLIVHFLITFWVIAEQNFWMTSLRKSLSQELRQSETFVAIAYLVPGFCILLVNPFTPCIVKKCGRPNTIILGLAINLIGFGFFGPLEFLPQQASFVMVGAALAGFGQSLSFVPAIPEIIQTLLTEHPQFYIGPVTDKVSSFAYLTEDSGAIIGTVAGDLIYNALGFRRMVLVFTVAHAVVLTIYIVFGKTGQPWCSSSQLQKERVKPTFEQEGPDSSRNLNNQE